MRFLVLLFSFAVSLSACGPSIDANKFITHYEQSNYEETATYQQTIEWWKNLDEASPYVSMRANGKTDAGLPLHLVVISPSKNFSPSKLKEKGKTVILINNGIHPGEPDGVDASMIFARSLLTESSFARDYNDLVFLIIPMFNVGGALNRNCCSRANQNGPKEYGFRGNARNLDLNRDFIKCDSKNAQTFTSIFNEWNPDVYLETHVTNGADYQYTMTHLASHPDKLTPALSKFVKSSMLPQMEAKMKATNEEMAPYVNVHGDSPDSGYTSFYDSPRYSTGYTALHNSIGLITETHMLKPYKDRVQSTLTFLNQLADFVNENAEAIQQVRNKANEQTAEQESFALDYKLNHDDFEWINFKGFKAYTDTSAVTGLPQLYYDRNEPWEKKIKFYHKLGPTISVKAPHYYLLPVAYSEVVDRLKLNQVNMKLIAEDTIMSVMSYEIESYETIKEPYEGHYLHKNVHVKPRAHNKAIRAYEYYLIDVQQEKKRFIIETLEPQARDSYFNWNFFDEILQRKEGFSSYIFDNEAEQMLNDDPALRTEFDAQKRDSNFASSQSAQLYWLYERSAHFEKDRFKMYPVLRVEKK